MNDHTEFFARWSRRKYAAAGKIKSSKSENTSGDNASAASAAFEQQENAPSFDPVSLPPIESIGAESNVRAFLEAGVPDDLARTALRRAWSLDPSIRDFVGLSENSWDFNAPGAMAGFGPIEAKEVGRMLTRVLGEPDVVGAAVHPPVSPQSVEESLELASEASPVDHKVEPPAPVSAKSEGLDFNDMHVAGEVAEEPRANAAQSARTSSECRASMLGRGHGGALPKLL